MIALMPPPREYDLLQGLKYLTLGAMLFVFLVGCFIYGAALCLNIPGTELVLGGCIGGMLCATETFLYFAYGFFRRACRCFDEDESVDNSGERPLSSIDGTVAFLNRLKL